jgi:hypothetical protein
VDFVFYNLSDDLKPQREVHTVMPIIALSKDGAHHASFVTTVGELIDNNFFTKSPKRIADIFANAFTASSGAEVLANQIKGVILTTEQLQRKKFKTKQDMLVLAKGKQIMNDARIYVQKTMHNAAISYEMHRVNVFIKSKLLGIRYVSANKDNPADDEKLIKAFQDVVSEDEFGAMMVCGENMMQEMRAIELTNGNGADGIEKNSYARLKLFPLPGFLSLKKRGYNLLREEMKAELEAWWQALHDTAVELSALNYSEENIASVQQVVLEKVATASELLRKKLEASIYIQQLSNDEYGEYGSTMYFALTSRVELLKAYHRTGQMPDKVLDRLQQYFGDKKLNDKICCFLYHVVPDCPPPRVFDKDWQDEWERIWHDSYNE